MAGGRWAGVGTRLQKMTGEKVKKEEKRGEKQCNEDIKREGKMFTLKVKNTKEKRSWK